VLPLHPGGLGALLDVPGLVRDQHSILGRQSGDRVGPHPVAQFLRVSGRLRQEAVQPVGVGLTREFGQLPHVLAQHLAQQPTHHRAQVLPRGRTREHIVDRGAQRLQLPTQRPNLGLVQLTVSTAPGGSINPTNGATSQPPSRHVNNRL